jgi:predicted Zn-dependent protease
MLPASIIDANVRVRHLLLSLAGGIAASLVLPTRLAAQDSGCGGSTRAAPAAHYSPAQLRGIGRRVLAGEVEHYGRLADPADRRDVAATVARLVTASGAPLDVQWELVRNPEINAFALPGGILVVNEGLLQKFHQIASSEGKAPTERTARFTGYLAAVLGHELAHITLGHSDSLANERLRCPTARLVAIRRTRVDTLNADEERALADALTSTKVIRDAAGARADESAADQVGALYMLRAGWTIQQAMDLFRHFDEMEHSDHDRGLRTLSWLVDHPRASQREAALEQFRGQLKMHQAEFDDALLLVQHGVLLDSAVAMLDRVLTDFPKLAPVRHARAAALQEMWMETAPPSARQVQTTVPTYEARFIGGIRTAGVGDQALLDSARREYRRVLAIQMLPFALSNLAVLDAYAGDARSARARADSAARLLPQSIQVANNRAAVLYLTGDVAGARTAWTAMSKSTGAAIIQFNLARAMLAAGDRAAATPVLESYLDAEGDSPWGREASRLLGRNPNAVPARTAARATRSAARVAGVQLGMSAADVAQALGRADSAEDVRGGSLLHYGAKGLIIGVTSERGAVLIIVSSAAAGAVDGITVGDPMRTVAERWGHPVANREEMTAYDRGEWIGVVEAKDGRVGQIALRLK